MILVTGSNGLLASEIKKISAKMEICFASQEELDITSEKSIDNYLAHNSSISVIINCAAGADAEHIESNPDWGFDITVNGPRLLAQASSRYGIKLVHISTDYVFDGSKNTPYKETDRTNGLSMYGKLKAEGELAVLEHASCCAIVRTAWLFSEQCRDFIGTMIRISKDRQQVAVVYDQVGSPTYVPDLAKALLVIANNLNTNEKEIFHFTNEGVCSWYDIACVIMRKLKIDCEVKPILSKDFVTKAKRPHYSVLDKSKVKNRFNLEIRHYSEALEQCLDEIKLSDE